MTTRKEQLLALVRERVDKMTRHEAMSTPLDDACAEEGGVHQPVVLSDREHFDRVMNDPDAWTGNRRR